MTRAEAIKCIEEDGIRLGAGDFVDVEALKVAVECMKEQDVTDINVGNKWISVKDRLPEYDRKVLVTDVRDGYISISELKAGGKGLKDYWECEDGMRLPVSEITHWMPLPEPPKEDAVK